MFILSIPYYIVINKMAFIGSEVIGFLTCVSKFANIIIMNYTIEYFHAQVKAVIESWPLGILADYARIVELLMEFGPSLRMPHSRALGSGLFELRPRGREGIGRALY